MSSFFFAQLLTYAKILVDSITLFEIFIFCPKIQLWSPEKICRFVLGENSWKCCGFGLFSCWQLWFHEKNCQKKFGWKTRENVGIFVKIEFLDKKWRFRTVCVNKRWDFYTFSQVSRSVTKLVKKHFRKLKNDSLKITSWPKAGLSAVLDFCCCSCDCCICWLEGNSFWYLRWLNLSTADLKEHSSAWKSQGRLSTSGRVDKTLVFKLSLKPKGHSVWNLLKVVSLKKTLLKSQLFVYISDTDSAVYLY